MKYIFKDGNTIGENPIENFQIGWYDMERDGSCFDESFVNPENFTANTVTYVDTEENANDSDRARVFVNMKNGDKYELVLRKVNTLTECQSFNGLQDTAITFEKEYRNIPDGAKLTLIIIGNEWLDQYDKYTEIPVIKIGNRLVENNRGSWWDWAERNENGYEFIVAKQL